MGEGGNRDEYGNAPLATPPLIITGGNTMRKDFDFASTCWAMSVEVFEGVLGESRD